METQTIAYFKHGLGNLILLTPALQALASMDQSGKIDICMSSEWQDPRRPAYDDFFDKWDLVDKVVNYPKEDFQKKYKRWFYTGHTEHSEALTIFMKKCPIQSHTPDWRNRYIHELFWYMEIMTKIGYRDSIPNQFVPLDKEPIIDKKKKKLIGICNGTYSNKMLMSKKWPYFNELVKILKNYYNCLIVKVGYQEELNDVETDIDYVNKLSFTQTAKVISQMDLFITTDTANMHVGDALNIPMIVLFGGTLVSKNGAISKNATNLTLGLGCQPCQRTATFTHCDHFNCLNYLTIGHVMNEVRRKLNGCR